MVYANGLERATELADLSLDRIRQFQLPPHPENFTLWYTYSSGDIPDLTRAVDRLIRDRHAVTEPRCNELYRRFLGMDGDAQAVRETGERTQRLLAQVVDLLQGAGADNHRFGAALDGFQHELDEPLTIDQLRSMIAVVATETRTIAEQHGRLQSQIAETSAQLNEMRAHLQAARREAITDSLTGLGNRKAFDEALAETTADAAADHQPLSLLMIDIDYFKRFNDTHGHIVGDHVLKLVARVLTECIKGRDIAARYGGEEFAIVLPQTTAGNAALLAEQVRKTVGSRHIVNRARNESFGNVTLSIGVAEYVPGEPLMQLIQRADAALYRAKRNGRNRVSGGPGSAAD